MESYEREVTPTQIFMRKINVKLIEQSHYRNGGFHLRIARCHREFSSVTTRDVCAMIYSIFLNYPALCGKLNCVCPPVHLQYRA